jgi:hypothetical protein
MSLDRSQADKARKPTPEAQTAEWRQELGADWSTFVDGIERSRETLAAWRAAGNSGWPPGWISAKEYRSQRRLGVRSGLQ